MDYGITLAEGRNACNYLVRFAGGYDRNRFPLMVISPSRAFPSSGTMTSTRTFSHLPVAPSETWGK